MKFSTAFSLAFVAMICGDSLLCAGVAKVDESELGLIPRPSRVEVREGRWTLKAGARIVALGAAAGEAAKLADALAVPLGWKPPVVEAKPQPGDIEMVLVKPDDQMGEEGYRLSVSSNNVVVQASTPRGLFYGAGTLRQLLPACVLGSTTVTGVSVAVPEPFPGKARRMPPSQMAWTAPCVEIIDSPRFPWRGLLLDPARHFLPPEFIKKFVDVMALHKFNTLQLHLTDDQGWRLEIRKYPRLTQIGSVRKESPRRGDRDQGDGEPYGPFFYTQQQILELVAYAQARHVTLVPEIEIPGHFRAALAAHPEFSCTRRAV